MTWKLVTYTVQFCVDCQWKKQTNVGYRITYRCGQVSDKGELRPIHDIIDIPAWCPLEDANENEPTQRKQQ